MNRNIISATLYAYKHKEYGDIFLCLNSGVIDTLGITDSVCEAITSYYYDADKMDEMVKNLGDDNEYVYKTIYKDYTDKEGYSGTLEKVVSFPVKDFVRVRFDSDYRKYV